MTTTTEDNTSNTFRRLRKLEDKGTFESRAEGISRAWIRSRLGDTFDLKETKLTDSLRSGEVLWHLVETLKGGAPIAEGKHGNPAKPSRIDEVALTEQSGRGTRARMEASHNVSRVFSKMSQMGINVVGCSARDVVAGARSSHALGVVWAITLRAMHDDGNEKGYSLLRWAAVEAKAEDDAADLEGDPVFFQEQLVEEAKHHEPHTLEEEAKDSRERARDEEDANDDPRSPTITIRDLDTGRVLMLTPRTIHCSNGIVGDSDTTNRHRSTLTLWNADNQVTTEL